MPETSFSHFLILEQNQHNVYREVLIAGDLSQEDLDRAVPGMLQCGRNMSNTAGFNYGSDTVYFAQPSLSQFIPGGSGLGTFVPSGPLGLKNTPNNTSELTGRTPVESRTGAVLQYAPPTHMGCNSAS